MNLRRLISAAAAALMATSLVVAAPSAASATPAQCLGGANGFVNIPDDLQGTIASQRAGNGATVYLQFGQVNGVQRGWTMLGAHSGMLLSGDEQFWMDWSTDGGRNWIQCGPFTAVALSRGHTTPAQRTHPSYLFRGGALVRGQLLLTDWV